MAAISARITAHKEFVDERTIHFGQTGVVVIADGNSRKHHTVFVDDNRSGGERVLKETVDARHTLFKKQRERPEQKQCPDNPPHGWITRKTEMKTVQCARVQK